MGCRLVEAVGGGVTEYGGQDSMPTVSARDVVEDIEGRPIQTHLLALQVIVCALHRHW